MCMVVCDGLKGLPDAIGEVWPQALVQTCVIHLIRASAERCRASWLRPYSINSRPSVASTVARSRVGGCSGNTNGAQQRENGDRDSPDRDRPQSCEVSR